MDSYFYRLKRSDLKDNNVQRTSLSIKMNKTLFIYSVIVLVVLLEPEYVQEAQPALHDIYKIAKVFVAISVLLFYFVMRIKLNGLLLAYIIFEGTLLLSTIIGTRSFYAWFVDGALLIVLVIFMQTLMESNIRVFYSALSFVFGSYVHINSICRIVFPGGMYYHQHGYWNCWFLGYDNLAVPIITIGIMLSLYGILSRCSKHTIWNLSVIISGISFVIIEHIGAGIIAGAIFFVLIILGRNRLFQFMLRKGGYAFVISMIVLFFLLQLIGLKQPLILAIISSVGKVGTFSSRGKIWSVAWSDILSSKLILGRGVNMGAAYEEYFGLRWAAHLHCYYLQVLYEGGIVAFVALLAVIFVAIHGFNVAQKSSSSLIFLIGLFAFMMVWQVDAYDAVTRYVVFALFLVYNAGFIEKNLPKYKRRKIKIVFSG